MELLMPTGEKTEKEGTLIEESMQQERKTDSEMLEQIDGKLDVLLASAETKEG